MPAHIRVMIFPFLPPPRLFLAVVSKSCFQRLTSMLWGALASCLVWPSSGPEKETPLRWQHHSHHNSLGLSEDDF